MTPNDPDSYVGIPDLFTPHYYECHISVVFTWDIFKAEMLRKVWFTVADCVKIGGPALGDRGETFQSGMYIKNGVTITSRGCPNNCSFCFVPKREGKLRELPIVTGNIVQDNNLLACSRSHIDRVFSMLKTQNHIDFAGGFEAARITDEIVEQLRGLKIYQMWLAYDTPNAEKQLEKAVNRLSKYFSRDKIRCYVLIGYEGDTIENAENRLRRSYEIGCLPFAMRYRTPDLLWKGTYLYSQRQWNLLQRQWTRPAIIKTIMKR